MNADFSLCSDLKQKIQQRSARILTIGLGYVGLPLALTISETGFPVIGLDINKSRVSKINSGQRVISYFSESRISDAIASGGFTATSDPSEISHANIVLICVPSPLSPTREPDLSYVIKAAEYVAAWIKPGQLIVVESTVWPGATAEVVKPILEQRGLLAGKDFFLGFSPEREDPGNETHTTRNIPKIIGADDAHSRDLLDAFYSQIVSQAVPVSSCATAEAVKLVENSFRTVNIALVNELKVALGAMGIDVWEVIEAAATKPFGYMPFYPGPGIGGDCIPVSPVYMSWRARDVGASVPIIDLARFSNDAAPDALAGRIASDLLARSAVPIQGANLLVLGISYKRDIEDTRESPALAILDRLEAMGAICDYHDPYFPVIPKTRDHPSLSGRRSIPLTECALREYDSVIVTTDHSMVDYSLVAQFSHLIFDTRNVFHKRGIVVDGIRLVKI
ncbi:nucleotide sugar dehydrogenase [Pseudoruegeria sp. SK021]|uniref:nucleotide sugar dehydrogenase n=1 Tax=Pseudoruegeria sp. SK021 TaxID=1933035 RepID=UPI000A231FE3|nr:nucleotide sugar dehydrogenase [Pseudoruegeria sp. SK021]OSP55080.1 UDP-N-acetyl-D-glucosamine dehydrogenase [Pseudoruegeria sp. SK021]